MRERAEESNNRTTEKPASFAASYYSNGIKLRAEALSGFLLFEGIPAEDCATIVATAYQGSYSPNKTMFFEGDPVSQVMFLTSGSVKLSQTGPSGQEVILRVVGPGEILCAECFMKYHHCSTARSMQPSTAVVWGVSQFEAIAARFPALARNISCILLQTLNQLEVRFREVSTEKVATRLSSELVRLARRVGQGSEEQVQIAISQRDLAQLTGTTLFSVSRILGRWEEQGIVRPQRQGVVVLNILALESMSQVSQVES